VTLEADTAAAKKRLEKMAKLGITFDGRHYHYGSRRYQRLADAISYARLQLGLPADPKDAQ
jgi:hypothetical protein